jgi:hypothetical protein
MKPLFFLLVLFITGVAYSQVQLNGVVLNAETGAPVPAASIFLANTSVGTTAAANGRFTLALPAGRFELIVSSVGYQTYTQQINSQQTEALTIKLQPRAQELETVIVEPFEKNGWDKWGRFFIENFIGHSAFAQNCIIKNTDAIKFRHNKKENTLTAMALEPLVIENKALGYSISYQLEGFSYDFKSHYLIYLGYPYFQPMKGGAARQRQWAARRQEVFEGSIMHFMRSLYRNTLAQEGFQVQALQKIPNWEKQRVKAAKAGYSKRITNSNGSISITDQTPEDSAGYYNRILAQSDYFDQVNKQLLTGDSIAYAVNNTTAGFGFDNYLLVIYLKKEAPDAYVKQFPKNGTAMASQITLLNNHDLEVQANGNYYSPVDLLSQGYWAWSEKLATMLPFDYVLPQKGK